MLKDPELSPLKENCKDLSTRRTLKAQRKAKHQFFEGVGSSELVDD
jgi:hypothetical protein